MFKDAAFFYNFKINFQCKHDPHEICKEYKYGMTKLITKKGSFIVPEKDRQIVYDSDSVSLILGRFLNFKYKTNYQRDKLILFLRTK